MKKLLIALAVGILFMVSSASAEAPYDFAWGRQSGTSGIDYNYGIAADPAGNVFICGQTQGNLGGPNAGDYDAYISKYDAYGSLLWTHQLGQYGFDGAMDVATNAAGNIFITGHTDGSLGGQTNAGSTDAFLSKFDTSGNVLWTRQLGTSAVEASYGIATDAVGNIFITGCTTGSLYGSNAGNLDVFVSKYDPLGSLLWTRQQGTSGQETSNGVATDTDGNVYIGGGTMGSLDGGPYAGQWDAFVSKYDASGTLLWTHQRETSADDYIYDVEADADGNVLDVDASAATCASIIIKTNGEIILTPAKLSVIKLGGEDANMAIMCTKVNNMGAGGQVIAQPIIDTWGGVQGAADGLNGTFARKVLIK